MGTFKGSSSTTPPPFSTLLKESEIKGAASLSFTCNVRKTVAITNKRQEQMNPYNNTKLIHVEICSKALLSHFYN
jgi:hypothetical protein